MNQAPGVHLEAGALTADIALRGAELRSLRHGSKELIWPGDAQWWPYSAPLLFPIIGRLAHGRFLHEGRVFDMPAHGLARTATFTVLSVTPSRTELSLCASPGTRGLYPFDFELKVAFELTTRHLRQQVCVINRGSSPMPASVGFHPGFNWPAGSADRAGHHLRFAQREDGGVFRINGAGQLVTGDAPLPVRGTILPLDDALFADGAIVLDPVRSTSLQYRDALGPVLELEWTGCTQLGLWTLPGAPFVCFEPWRGHPPPVDSPQTLTGKPGLFQLPPGQSTMVELRIWPGSRDASP